VCLQSAAAVLGEPHQESRLCVRRSQVEHRRLVPVGRRTDVHGLLLDERTQTQQGLTVQQTPLRQRHSKVPQVGREVPSTPCFLCLPV